ncbi:helix-turn-helix domain-containing protein [Streptomyces sp. NPDC089424]|uniref:helix-turn-helix domain-containing protein n=1 Tax=Streptomyces sp. NPDC089424 TaxID=3365917 RepID=UPI0037FAB394
MPEQAMWKKAKPSPRGDLGRRVFHRRAELGLTRRETAAQAGMSTTYLRHLEEDATARPDAGVLLRLAGVLGTTVDDLAGGNVDLPPGLGRATRHGRFTELSAAECRTLIGMHGVGRIAVPTSAGPAIVPVNYSVVDQKIAFRTAPGTTPWQARGKLIAFEVDRIDDAFSQGWSVLVRGHAQAVSDPDEVRRLEERAYSMPWAGGRRDVWVRIDPVAVTGRRIESR